MQNAKDTFYEVLRNRLVALNPERTIVLRGVVRPGLLVEENEMLSGVAIPDCFRLRWSAARVDPNGTLPLAMLECCLDYETAGSTMNGGMDRGRTLAAMDTELQGALNESPRNAVKLNYSALASGNAAVAMQTKVWWSEAAFGEVVTKEDRLARTATIQLMSYQEAGEL